MIVAHLILVHANPIQLKRLISKLMHNNAIFFIHVDAKKDIQPFRDALKEFEKVHFVNQRVNIQWATYSMVEATISGFKAIIDSGFKIDYINLLSGQDYPIQPISKFHEFLQIHAGKAFMECLDVETEWTEAISRVKNYHFNHWNFPGKFQFQRLVNSILPDRKMPEGLIPVGRSQWFTITSEHVSFLLQRLESSPKIVRFFTYSWAPDELVFQTLLFNSPFKKDIVNNNLRYIDWSEHNKNPKLLSMQDFKLFMQSGKYFARKFKENDEVLDAIDEVIG